MNEAKYVDWCQRQWNMIKLGGVWVVPRSGLTFRRTEDGFALCDVAQSSKPAFREYQKSDFLCIQRHFDEAGLTVTNESGVLPS